MDTLKWDEIIGAVEAYRASPQQSEFDALCRALSDCTLYVPVGDFDGNNAVISPIHSVQGGSFIPLYAAKENVRPAQHSEGVRPADWQHILTQLSSVEGCVLEPYSLNFAFDRRFVDALVASSEGDGGEIAGSADGGKVAQEQESTGSSEETESGKPAVHAWPGLDGGPLNLPVPQSEPLPPQEPVPSQGPAPIELKIPHSIPSSLNDAMQAVSNECGVPLWLFEVQPDGSERSYLMIVDASKQWFEDGGARLINSVLARFPDPGTRLDFLARESEIGSRLEGQAPHYLPRVNAGPSKKGTQGQTQGLFRRLFKR